MIGLPSDVAEALIDIARREGAGDYVDVLRRAVLEHRKRLFDPGKPVTVTIEVGAELEALAVHDAWGAPRMWLADPRVHIELVCIGDEPTAAEADAIERLTDAVLEARDLFRNAHRASGRR